MQKHLLARGILVAVIACIIANSPSECRAEDYAKRYRNAIDALGCVYCDGKQWATCFVINAQSRQVITCYHAVAEPIARIKVSLGGAPPSPVELVYASPGLDLAVLRVQGTGALKSQVRLRPSPPIVGEAVWTIGQPGNKRDVLLSGNISAPPRYSPNPGSGGWDSYTGSYHPEFTTTIRGGGGLSGAPIFDRSGEVVGLEFANDSRGYALARPLTHILPLTKAVVRKEFPPIPYIGALFANTAHQGGEWTRKYHMLDMRGVCVYATLPESPATGKICIGDLIQAVAIGETRTGIRTLDQLAAVIESCRVGKPITTELLRYNSEKQKWDSVRQLIVVGDANADTTRRTLQVIDEAVITTPGYDATACFSVLNREAYPLRGVRVRLVLPEDYVLAQCYMGPWTSDVFKNRAVMPSDRLTLSKDIASSRGIVLDAFSTGNSESCDAVVADLQHVPPSDQAQERPDHAPTLKAIFTYRGQDKEALFKLPVERRHAAETQPQPLSSEEIQALVPAVSLFSAPAATSFPDKTGAVHISIYEDYKGTRLTKPVTIRVVVRDDTGQVLAIQEAEVIGEKYLYTPSGQVTVCLGGAQDRFLGPAGAQVLPPEGEIHLEFFVPPER